jgi:hypothetical protein
MGARSTAGMESKKGRRRNMVSKDEDEAFEQELKAAPWGYGQQKPLDFHRVIYEMRRVGLHKEADWLLREWHLLTTR